MSGPSENEIADSQLLNIPQSLKLRSVYDLPDFLVESDVAVDRVQVFSLFVAEVVGVRVRE